ncbi:MAG: hypothetical protein WDN66_04425 [Candidatus Saccharibacteria bacterium]
MIRIKSQVELPASRAEDFSLSETGLEHMNRLGPRWAEQCGYMAAAFVHDQAAEGSAEFVTKTIEHVGNAIDNTEMRGSFTTGARIFNHAVLGDQTLVEMSSSYNQTQGVA